MQLALRTRHHFIWSGKRASGRLRESGSAVGGLGGDKPDSSGTELSAIRMLTKGFEAQVAGRGAEALIAYRRVQEAKPVASPLLRSLAGNAEGLLLLRAPRVITGALAADGGDTLETDRADNSLMPLESCSPGEAILAPWAGDGEEYAAVISSVNAAAGECVVNWDDGGDTHRNVPLAAVTTMRGGVSRLAAEQYPSEVGMWAARRALRRALHKWEMQAEIGTAHDAFVDLAGLLSDTALAEVKAALAAPSHRWLAEGLNHARRHLQRARFSAERAYGPDARALAVIYINRAEILRIAAATTTVSGAVVWNCSAGSHVKKSLEEVFESHERGAMHLANATWKVQKDSVSWSPHGGHVKPVVVHELLWAKALASQAAVIPGPLPKKRKDGRPITKSKRRLHRLGASDRMISLPEKMVPSPSVAAAQDSLLQEPCPARAAAARAWRALCAAAEEPIPRDRGAGDLWTADAAEARRLASLVGDRPMQSRLLLEVAVLIFTMGCRLGRHGWARTLAAPLAELASKQLHVLEITDDAALAARHTASVLAGAAVQIAEGEQVTRKSLLSTDVALGGAPPPDKDLDHIVPAPWMRWRLVGYIATQELWKVRIGTRRIVYLAAPTPLTWSIEGLALSETTPEPEDSADSPGAGPS